MRLVARVSRAGRRFDVQAAPPPARSPRASLRVSLRRRDETRRDACRRVPSLTRPFPTPPGRCVIHLAVCLACNPASRMPQPVPIHGKKLTSAVGADRESLKVCITHPLTGRFISLPSQKHRKLTICWRLTRFSKPRLTSTVNAATVFQTASSNLTHPSNLQRASSSDRDKTMAVFSSPAQGAAVLTAFFLPILTYLYMTRNEHRALASSSVSAAPGETEEEQEEEEVDAGPLPPPTEITALYIHPVKSCHGISVQSARVLPTGLDLGMPLSFLLSLPYPSLPHPSHTHPLLTPTQTANGCGSRTLPPNSSRSATPPK